MRIFLGAILALFVAQDLAASPTREAYLEFKNVFEGGADIEVNDDRFVKLLSGVSLGVYDPEEIDYCQPIISIEVVNTPLRGNLQWDLTKIDFTTSARFSSFSTRVSEIPESMMKFPRGRQGSQLMVSVDEIIYLDVHDALYLAFSDFPNYVMYTSSPVEPLVDALNHLMRVCQSLR